MNFKIKILKKLKEQLALEELSRNTYHEFLKKINNKKISNDIKKIFYEEIEHIKIVNEIIDIISKYKTPINKTKKPAEIKLKNISIKGEVILLLIYKTEDYMHKLISVLKQLPSERKIIYVSYNKIPKYIKKILTENKFNLNNIVFINGVNIKSEKDINVRPEDLTKLSIIINETAKRIKDVTILFDTISAFSIYHNSKVICQFISSMNDRARDENHGIIWVAIDDSEEKSINLKVATLCDKTVKM